MNHPGIIIQPEKLDGRWEELCSAPLVVQRGEGQKQVLPHQCGARMLCDVLGLGHGAEASKWDALPQSQSRVIGDLRPPGPPIPSHSTSYGDRGLFAGSPASGARFLQ